MPGGDGSRYAFRRLAHRQNDGLSHYAFDARARSLCRDRRCLDLVHGDLHGDSRVDDAYDYRCDCWSGGGAPRIGSSVERRAKHRCCVDTDHACCWRHCRWRFLSGRRQRFVVTELEYDMTPAVFRSNSETSLAISQVAA